MSTLATFTPILISIFINIFVLIIIKYIYKKLIKNNKTLYRYTFLRLN